MDVDAVVRLVSVSAGVVTSSIVLLFIGISYIKQSMNKNITFGRLATLFNLVPPLPNQVKFLFDLSSLVI